MHKMILAAASAVVLFAASATPSAAAPLTDLSSQIEVGPGGVRIGHGRSDSARRERRSECASLRRACANKDRRGEQGEGNCRRYRRICGG